MKKKTHRDHRYDVGILFGIEREEKNLSQTITAVMSGVSQTTWNHIEKCILFPTPDQFDRAVRGLDLDERKMQDIYRRAAADWERLGPPAATRTYNTRDGSSVDAHQQKRRSR